MDYVCGIIDFHKAPSDRTALLMSGYNDLPKPCVFINRYMTLVFSRSAFSVELPDEGKHAILCNSLLHDRVLSCFEKEGLAFAENFPEALFYIIYEDNKILLGKNKLYCKSVYYTFAGSALVFSTNLAGLATHPSIKFMPDSEKLRDISELKAGGLEYSPSGLNYTNGFLCEFIG